MKARLPSHLPDPRSLLSTLMGRAMAEYRGKADGQKINALLKEKLEKLVK